MGLGGILSGASSLMDIAAPFIQHGWDREAADHAMDRSQDSAREQMAFQERMSSTAYQRATADMKKAGINPMVAYAQGGASSPSGSSSTAPSYSTPVKFGDMGNTARDLVRLKTEVNESKTRQDMNIAEAENRRKQGDILELQKQIMAWSARMAGLKTEALKGFDVKRGIDFWKSLPAKALDRVKERFGFGPETPIKFQIDSDRPKSFK